MEHGPPHNEYQQQASAKGFEQNNQHGFRPLDRLVAALPRSMERGDCRHAGVLCLFGASTWPASALFRAASAAT
jgi:hypothetical protein